MILAQFRSLRCSSKAGDTARDQRVIPFRAILFLQTQNISFGVRPRRESCCIQQHQSDKRMRAGLIGERVLAEQRGEPDRLVTKIFPYEILPGGCLVPFVEQQIKGLKDAIEPRKSTRLNSSHVKIS